MSIAIQEPVRFAGPPLPRGRGVLSSTVVDLLAGGRPSSDRPAAVSSTALAAVADADPYGIDLHLALYTCYELHYRGFADVDPEWEWEPGLLDVRRRLETRFHAALEADIATIGPEDDVAREMSAMSVEPIDGTGPSYFLRDEGTWAQMREYLAVRSLYHLKEADPHAWAIPRLRGRSKAAFVAVEFDEYGGGRGDRMHQQLFADLMEAADLDSTYLGYLDRAPAQALVTVNLMSMIGLHRTLRGAAVGHLAATEITSSPGSRRLAEALERLDAPPACAAFYREHVEADAVHEQVMRTDVVGDLVATEPELHDDVLFGMRAFDLVERRLADHMMESWQRGERAIDLD
ncbi:iron-containing redox enzyme family protein [Williamsia sp. MIQD14]|uniref:iron-containing redox enzyme family protein n=1 Tax=Williamsia sp. MIQD14 TaxID=3425703 RepID=UPI003D9FBBCA